MIVKQISNLAKYLVSLNITFYIFTAIIMPEIFLLYIQESNYGLDFFFGENVKFIDTEEQSGVLRCLKWLSFGIAALGLGAGQISTIFNLSGSFKICS